MRYRSIETGILKDAGLCIYYDSNLAPGHKKHAYGIIHSMNDTRCPECDAPLEHVTACREYLNEMIKWDFEDFTGVGKIHHLTVLSYNLQHPSVYSQKGLADAKESLKEFIQDPESFAAHDERNRKNLGSDVRDWKIAGTAEDSGKYRTAPTWTMRASDVIRAGLPEYVENVKKWSTSVFESLQASGNLE